MQEDIYKTLGKKSRKFYRSMPRALTFKDPEDVHQTRVAGRTAMALLDLLSDEDDLADPEFKKMRCALKKGMGQLGRVRDADVMIEAIEKRLPAMMPAEQDLMHGWLRTLRSGRRKLRQKAGRKLPQYIDRKWKKRMAGWLRTNGSPSIDAALIEDRLRGLRTAKEQAFQAVREDVSGPISFDNEELLNRFHRARIRVKKLRYALESVAPFLGEDDAELQGLKSLQEQLGHVQDLRIWAQKLRSYGGDPEVIAGVLDQWQEEMTVQLQKAGIAGGKCQLAGVIT